MKVQWKKTQWKKGDKAYAVVGGGGHNGRFPVKLRSYTIEAAGKMIIRYRSDDGDAPLQRTDRIMFDRTFAPTPADAWAMRTAAAEERFRKAQSDLEIARAEMVDIEEARQASGEPDRLVRVPTGEYTYQLKRKPAAMAPACGEPGQPAHWLGERPRDCPACRAAAAAPGGAA